VIDDLAKLLDEPAMAVLCRRIARLNPAERKALAGMPETFLPDLARELVTAALFGDPGSLSITLHHRDHGKIESTKFEPERERRIRKIV
jgi:hypothetical protein